MSSPCSFYVDVGGLTSAKTAAYLIAVSTDFSIDPLISGGGYSLSNPSSSWSDERRTSTFTDVIYWQEWAMEKVRTVLFAEKSNSRNPLRFPMTIASVLLDQKKFEEWSVMTTNSGR